MPVAAALLSVTGICANAQPGSRIPAREAKAATIAGRVTAADTGKPLRRARVTVITDGAYSRPIVANTNSAGLFEVKDVPAGSYYVGASRAGYLGDGAFEFKDVPPGVFSVNAGAGAEEIVAMNGVDVSDLMLTAKTGSAVSGTVVTDEGPPPFPLSGVRVSLEAPDHKVLPTVRVTDLDANASFRFSSLGGPFLFRVIGLPDGWMLGSVRFDDKDITDTPWDVPTGGKQLSPLRITVTEKVGTVNGTVVDGAGKPSGEATVVLFSDQPELWMPGSRFIQVTRPERDGHFTITNLPAGTYRAVARDFVETGQWYDRAFLEDAREDAPRIVLEEGGSETVTLKLQPPQRR
jgi:hypothetical protein